MNAFSSDRPALLIIDMVKDNLDEKNLHPLKASTSKLWTSTAKTFSIRFLGFGRPINCWQILGSREH